MHTSEGRISLCFLSDQRTTCCLSLAFSQETLPRSRISSKLLISVASFSCGAMMFTQKRPPLAPRSFREKPPENKLLMASYLLTRGVGSAYSLGGSCLRVWTRRVWRLHKTKEDLRRGARGQDDFCKVTVRMFLKRFF